MFTNQSLTDPSSSSNFSNLIQTEDDNPILLYPELFNTILLMSVLVPVYKGIEIEHPIYKILFSNLCVSLLSSLANFAFFFFPIKVLKFTRALSTNNWVCIMYHYTSWCILSILRYIYIKHSDWLHKKFPKTSTIGNLATAAIALACLLEFLLCLAVFTLTGWPRIKNSEVSKPIFILRGSTPLGILVSLIGISCFFYAKILRENRKVGENDTHIDGTASQLTMNNFEMNNFEMNNLDVTSDGGIWTGERSTTVEENNSTKPKKKALNKVDIFVMEVSHVIMHESLDK
jgi:hypothetical protein